LDIASLFRNLTHNSAPSSNASNSGRCFKTRSLVKKIYFNNKPLTDKDYNRSRNLSILEGCTYRTVYNLTSEAYLAGFACYMGITDSLNGLLGAIPVLAGVIQVFSPIIFEKMQKRKMAIALLNLFHRLLLGLMMFIPLITDSSLERMVLIFSMFFISHLLFSFANPAASSWLIDLTPENIRGRYFGIRESTLLAVAIVFTLAMGRVLDHFKNNGSEFGGFVILFSFILVLAFVNFIVFSLMKEPPVKRNKSNLTVKSVVTIPLRDKKFKKIIILFILWNIGVQALAPFTSVYMVSGLKLVYTYISAVVMIGTFIKVLSARYLWGRLADSRSWVFIIKASIGLLAITHFMWSFVNPSTAYIMVPLLHIMSGTAWGGIVIATFNIQFIFAPEEGRTVYIGFNSAMGGLVGFASTLTCSILLRKFPNLRINLVGFSIGSMQMLFAISGVLLGICTLYIHLFLKRPETMIE
jgi:MFS family permease